jgi:hypothetical protein
MSESSNCIIEGLWNQDVSETNYGKKEQYYEHIFEQYKIFIEMADKVSSRRNQANTFFLSLHTLIITAVTFWYEKGPRTPNAWTNLIPLFALWTLCYVWWRLIKSYRQLNTAKYKVIGEYERKLPSSPYWSAEWKALGEGKDRKLYWQLSDLENWIPILFGLLYLIGFIAILLS